MIDFFKIQINLLILKNSSKEQNIRIQESYEKSFLYFFQLQNGEIEIWLNENNILAMN